jgi:hypothetical protein
VGARPPRSRGLGEWEGFVDDEVLYPGSGLYAQADPGQVAEAVLHIDPVRGLLFEYHYVDQKGLRVLMRVDEE